MSRSTSSYISGVFAGLGFMFDECYQSFAHTVEAVKTRGVEEPNDSVGVPFISSSLGLY